MSGLCAIKCSGAGALCGNKLINIHVQKKTAAKNIGARAFSTLGRRCEEAKCQVVARGE
jgi:hypothetical protein